MNFDQIKKAEKRAIHFAGQYEPCRLGWGDWGAFVRQGKYPFVENHMLMRPPAKDAEGTCRAERLNGWSYLSELLWLDSLAAAINRYVDAHRIDADHDFRYVLRWFQQQMFFTARGL